MGALRADLPATREEICKLKENPPATRARPDAQRLPKPAVQVAVLTPVYGFIERANIVVELHTQTLRAPVSRHTIWLVGIDETSASLLTHYPDTIVEVEGVRYVVVDPPHWRNVQHGWRVGLVPEKLPKE